MPRTFAMLSRRFHRDPFLAMMSNLLRTILLLALLVAQAGCATTESDLNYTRDQPVQKDGDNSYHGWNDANN